MQLRPFCMHPVRAPMAAPVLLLLLPVLAHLASSPASANENNLILTGDVLGKDEQLSNDAAVFVMQNDCNLVLYNTKGSGFVSNTFDQGTNCTLTLTDRGQLVVRNAAGANVWATNPGSKVGKYAAVIRADGQVAVYGPSVWSTPDFQFGPSAGGPLESQLTKAAPLARNVFFTDEIMSANRELTTRDYTLRMQVDCNLVLTKAGQGTIWESGTAGKGKKCVAKLDRSGELTVRNERSKVVFITGLASKKGDYVLILQINGQAVVYGPAIWSTAAA